MTGKKVKHISFGEGSIIKFDNNYFTVDFGSKKCEFIFPDAFEKFLSTDDSQLQYYIKSKKLDIALAAERKNNDLIKLYNKKYGTDNVITFNNAVYHRHHRHWIDDRGIVVPDALQQKLNNEYINSIDIESLPIRKIIVIGDNMKKSASLLLAIKLYEYAAFRCGKKELAYILPRITSCYRQCNMARKAIALFKYAKEEYGQDMLNPALPTSVAAAYCDIKEYENALKCCKRAYATGGKRNEELSLVYKRIKAESNLIE